MLHIYSQFSSQCAWILFFNSHIGNRKSFLNVLHPSTFTHTYNYQVIGSENGQDEDDAFQFKDQAKNVITLIILTFRKTSSTYVPFRDKYIPLISGP